MPHPDTIAQPKGLLIVRLPEGKLEAVRFKTLAAAREAARLVGFPAFAKRLVCSSQ